MRVTQKQLKEEVDRLSKQYPEVVLRTGYGNIGLGEAVVHKAGTGVRSLTGLMTTRGLSDVLTGLYIGTDLEARRITRLLVQHGATRKFLVEKIGLYVSSEEFKKFKRQTKQEVNLA